mmetsp:Transcript_50502/g.107581  ORF Transcript_50502/g.107581 Transcript_50502/m.107581 type:complete len:124 (+) Transcript_50502:2004-2375(+)
MMVARQSIGGGEQIIRVWYPHQRQWQGIYAALHGYASGGGLRVEGKGCRGGGWHYCIAIHRCFDAIVLEVAMARDATTTPPGPDETDSNSCSHPVEHMLYLMVQLRPVSSKRRLRKEGRTKSS